MRRRNSQQTNVYLPSAVETDFSSCFVETLLLIAVDKCSIPSFDDVDEFVVLYSRMTVTSSRSHCFTCVLLPFYFNTPDFFLGLHVFVQFAHLFYGRAT